MFADNEASNRNLASGKGKLVLLKPSTLASIVFLSVTALVLSYIAGVMSGRHYGRNVSPVPVAEIAAEAEKKEELSGILAPEELNFARELKGQGSKKPVFEEKKEDEVRTLTENEQKLESSGENLINSEPVQVKADFFDYLYQVAAFRDENSADALRQKLEGFGYRTILQKDGSLLLVQVKMRGTAQSTEEFIDLLRQLKLGAPILRSRVTVKQ